MQSFFVLMHNCPWYAQGEYSAYEVNTSFICIFRSHLIVNCFLCLCLEHWCVILTIISYILSLHPVTLPPFPSVTHLLQPPSLPSGHTLNGQWFMILLTIQNILFTYLFSSLRYYVVIVSAILFISLGIFQVLLIRFLSD